jgi:hypothetical protein
MVQINPRLNGLTSMRSTTGHRPWSGERNLETRRPDADRHLHRPAGLKTKFVKNATHNGLGMEVNGKKVE